MAEIVAPSAPTSKREYSQEERQSVVISFSGDFGRWDAANRRSVYQYFSRDGQRRQLPFPTFPPKSAPRRGPFPG